MEGRIDFLYAPGTISPDPRCMRKLICLIFNSYGVYEVFFNAVAIIPHYIVRESSLEKCDTRIPRLLKCIRFHFLM